MVGEGSFSTVYRGHYCGTDVAVKELKFKLSQVRGVVEGGLGGEVGEVGVKGESGREGGVGGRELEG